MADELFAILKPPADTEEEEGEGNKRLKNNFFKCLNLKKINGSF